MPVNNIVEDALRNLIVLYRQPILKLGATADEDRISHYEILTRFNYQGDHQSPKEWVDSLEDHNLCYLLDRQVVALLAEHITSTGDQSVYAVNVSGQTINQNGRFVYHVESCELPNTVIFECTETVLINLCAHTPDEPCCLQAVAALRHLSKRFTLAIDDFGVGAFRLSHLDSIKPRYVKIDGSFSQAIPDPTALSDIAAISSIAHSRGCEVVLEWVETAAQIEIARSLGINYVQGWGVAVPEELSKVTG